MKKTGTDLLVGFIASVAADFVKSKLIGTFLSGDLIREQRFKLFSYGSFLRFKFYCKLILPIFDFINSIASRLSVPCILSQENALLSMNLLKIVQFIFYTSFITKNIKPATFQGFILINNKILRRKRSIMNVYDRNLNRL